MLSPARHEWSGSNSGRSGSFAVWPRTLFLRKPQVPQLDRRVKPLLPGHPGGEALQGHGRGGGAGGTHQPLSGANVHPVRQRAGIQLLRISLAATPMPCGTGAMQATAPARPISSQDPRGRTALPSRMSSARLRLNGRFRDEFLNTELFTTAPEAQLLADSWPTQQLSTLRPHSALQGRTPLEAAQPGAAA